MSNSSHAKDADLSGHSAVLTRPSNTKVANIVTPPDYDILDGKPFKVSIKEQPVTENRVPWIKKRGDILENAGTARANIAATNEKPNGTVENNYTKDRSNQTVVQQHVDYWDQDHDGIIWPSDTYRGVRAWGWSPPLALLTALIINLGLSYSTVYGWFPDPFFRIWVDRLYKAKHGSDSMTYDNEGRFRPQNFEDLFAKYDMGNKGGLDVSDLFRFWKGQRMVFDLFGWSATFLEWTATYLLLWPEDGIMRKEDIRAVYDGSIFYRKAENHKKKQQTQITQRGNTSPGLATEIKKLI